MPRTGPSPAVPRLVGGVTLVAAGVAANTAFAPPLGSVIGLFPIALGVAGVTGTMRAHGPDGLRNSAKRWWLLAFAAFVPYGLATAPDGESAAAVGAAFAGPIVGTVLEAAAGATVLCAVSITVLYGFARYGVHPGRPTPEERVLTDGADD